MNENERLRAALVDFARSCERRCKDQDAESEEVYRTLREAVASERAEPTATEPEVPDDKLCQRIFVTDGRRCQNRRRTDSIYCCDGGDLSVCKCDFGDAPDVPSEGEEETALEAFGKYYQLRSETTLGEIVDYHKMEWLAWQSCWKSCAARAKPDEEAVSDLLKVVYEALRVNGHVNDAQLIWDHWNRTQTKPKMLIEALKAQADKDTEQLRGDLALARFEINLLVPKLKAAESDLRTCKVALGEAMNATKKAGDA